MSDWGRKHPLSEVSLRDHVLQLPLASLKLFIELFEFFCEVEGVHDFCCGEPQEFGLEFDSVKYPCQNTGPGLGLFLRSSMEQHPLFLDDLGYPVDTELEHSPVPVVRVLTALEPLTVPPVYTGQILGHAALAEPEASGDLGFGEPLKKEVVALHSAGLCFPA